MIDPPDTTTASGRVAWGSQAFERAGDAGANGATVAADDERVARIRTEVAAAFAQGGSLATMLPGFTARESQRDMALTVFDAIVERDTLVVEAGTGCGKTFAYLVPGLLAGGKLLVSAGTKTLQDQIFNKDLVAVQRALGSRVDIALLKGRQNYVCLHRLARAELEGSFSGADDASQLRHIVRFSKVSMTGDRVELATVPESATIWSQATSTRENCLGVSCPRFDDCFVYKARRKAQGADVVVVNHHLFLADLALRDDTLTEFLPNADAVIIDEAHQLPRIASEFFGEGWSLAQLIDLARDLRSTGLKFAADGADWFGIAQALESAARAFRLAIGEAGLPTAARSALDRLVQPQRLVEPLAAIAFMCTQIAASLESNAGRDPELDQLLPRCRRAGACAQRWQDAAAQCAQMLASEASERADSSKSGLGPLTLGTAEVVWWISTTAHGASMNETPLSPGLALQKARDARPLAWILTSATLTVAGRFDEFLHDIGMRDAKTAQWESPFDYPTQGLMYLPAKTMSPLMSGFAAHVAESVWPVVQASFGRAFILCATLRAVERVADRLFELMQRDQQTMPLFVQGTQSRRLLLDGFRACPNGILVGSVSFWEGIDVRGDALSVVAIDKLPFAPPDDPVVEARIRHMRSMGRNPFMEYQLPAAITLLRQGAGRLIRDENDRGVLMLLDERVLTKPYGKTVLASLPPMSRTRNLQTVQAFIGSKAFAFSDSQNHTRS